MQKCYDLMQSLMILVNSTTKHHKNLHNINSMCCKVCWCSKVPKLKKCMEIQMDKQTKRSFNFLSSLSQLKTDFRSAALRIILYYLWPQIIWELLMTSIVGGSELLVRYENLQNNQPELNVCRISRAVFEQLISPLLTVISWPIAGLELTCDWRWPIRGLAWV